MDDTNPQQPEWINKLPPIYLWIGCSGCLAVLLFVSLPVLAFFGIRIPHAHVWALAREVVRQEIVFFPDGQRLLFTKFGKKRSELMVLSLTDGTLRPLHSGESVQFSPRISPDGQHVVFCESTGGWRAKLRIVNTLDGTVRTLSSVNDKAAYCPVISPTGQRVAYASLEKSGKSHLRIVPLQGGEASDLAEPGNTNVVPVFSKDEKTLVYWTATSYGHSSPVGDDRFHGWYLCKRDLSNSKAVRLFTRDYYSMQPTIPVFMNGYVYFEPDEYDRAIPWRVKTEFLDAPEPTPLTERFASRKDYADRALVQIQNPKDFGDNRQLLVEVTFNGPMTDGAKGEVYLLDTATGELQQITDLGRVVADFALSPNREDIAVLTVAGEIWMCNIKSRTKKQLL